MGALGTRHRYGYAASVRRAIIILGLMMPTPALAQVPDLSLPGNLPGQLTDFGVGMRDALRKQLGTCYRPVDGGILVCGHRPSYRMDRSVFEAERNHGSGSEYEHYVEARARQQGSPN